ncbi:hypothetical protein [Arenimonas oryziterrae]|uniref:Uncharacterized protein n=1 Tax=Arenimonas oryziterrae DSM 21050 = YC6267 TaxID=1121015 RepID=A0A091AWJ9_9GAMM|nr:hypothetical protein [Arenimonas oryziterrae]KFN44673.1 hypothetical protein N789_01285 [Arenimonas oryziterrae DSM 21050 = YC6267]
MKSVSLFVLLALSVLSPLRVSAAEVEDYRQIYKDLTARHAQSVVTVKFVMSVNSSGKEERIEDRTQALLVGANGLLLVPDRAVSMDFGAFMPSGGGQGAAPVAKSSDFRVRLPGSDDWLPADLVTRDSQLGLAWLRLRQPPAGLSFVNLSDGIRAEPGMVFFSLLRTSDEWGGVPVFRPGFVMGETRTPKTVLLVDGVPGMAFSADGHPMGYVDIDFGRLMRSSRNGGSGLGLDVADTAMQMTPIDKVASATAQAAKLPVVASGK